jgi:hypothetical protein
MKGRALCWVLMMVVVLILFCLLAAGSGKEASSPGPEVRPPEKKADLTYVDRKAWHHLLKWPKEYEESFDASLGADQDKGWMQFFLLAPQKYLVEVQCDLFAYQAGFIYLFYDESTSPPSSRLLTFDSFYRDEKKLKKQQEPLVVGLPTFDPKRRELSVWTKGRGLGDCGSWGVYQIKDGLAVLKEFRAKDKCDGRYVNPKKYPRLYPR